MAGVDSLGVPPEIRDLRLRVRDELEAEYVRLRTFDRPAILDLLAADPTGAGAVVVHHELALLDARIAAVHDYFGDLQESPTGGRPGLGSCVEVDLGAGPRWVLLANLAMADDDVVAVDSPLGRALLGAYPGETFAFATSEGPRTGRLVAVEGADADEAGSEPATAKDQLSAPRTLLRLDRPEALRLLGDARVGALAFCMLGSPHVEVVNFALDGGEPVFRIGSSAKLAAVGRGRPFALHVDRVDEQARTGWSVTVTGHVRLVRGEEAERLAEHVVPWAGGQRPHVVRMFPHQVEGRQLVAAT